MSSQNDHPSGPSFKICELPTAPGTPDTLQLSGALDANAAPRLSDELERRLLAGQKHLTLDFDGVAFISSAGVGSLIASVGEFRDEGGEIQLIKLAPDLRRVFELLDLLDYLTVS
jgi:stage II sporulation protein AA (anti-sigma F factor antagonist)